MATSDLLAEAYERLHAFGPEFGGDEEGNHGLTNHGPMAAEVMVRRGLDIDLDAWLDRYVRRLAELPRAEQEIDAQEWRRSLGVATQLPDWAAYFCRELDERPWRDVLAQWWPRLLPGIVAGSTHGVIRVGHAVRALESGEEPASKQAKDELAHGLAFWAARYRVLARTAAPGVPTDVRLALDSVRRLPDQSGRIADRLDRLELDPAWSSGLGAVTAAAVDEVPGRLADLTDAGVSAYLRFGHGAPVLLVHVATAPNAVLHVLPSLPTAQWIPSLDAAWAAASAIVATYAPRVPASRKDILRPLPAVAGPAYALQRAADHGDEHVLKFADTAVESFDRTADPDALSATAHAANLIARD